VQSLQTSERHLVVLQTPRLEHRSRYRDNDTHVGKTDKEPYTNTYTDTNRDTDIDTDTDTDTRHTHKHTHTFVYT